MCDDFIINRYIKGREEAANGLLEILIKNIDKFKFEEDWLFPNISLSDWKDLKKQDNNLRIENTKRIVVPKGGIGNTWDNLFKREGRIADAVFKSKEGLVIVENKKSETGFYIQQLLYYYLYCLYNYDNIQKKDIGHKFYIINTVIDSNEGTLNIQPENKHLFRGEFIKGKDVLQLRDIIISAIKELDSLLQQPDAEIWHNKLNGFLNRLKGNKDVFENFKVIKRKTGDCKRINDLKIFEKANSNVGKFVIKYLDKDEIEWIIVPWSKIKWGEMEQAINNNKAHQWHEIIQKELFLLSEYYNKSTP